MKLNKFFALRTNFEFDQSDPDAIRSGGGTSSGGASSGRSQVSRAADKVKSAISSPGMLSRDEVLKQLNFLNTQITDGVGVKAGKSKTQAKEDAYAKWIETNRDQIKLVDVAAFFNNPGYGVDEVTRDYIDGPGGRGYQYQEAADFGELDFTGEGGRPPVITNTGTFANIDDAFDNMLDRYAQVGNLEDTVDEDGNIVEGIMRPSSFNAADYARGGKYDYVAPSAAQDFRNLDVTKYDTVGDLITQGKIAKGLFDPQTFNTRDITRGTPAVTRGLDAQGNPTTAITMGDTTATGTGPNIGQLTTDLTFPSTGMGINADGTGTTTTGTMDTTGNIVKLDPDVTGLNLLQSSAGDTSTLDPNAVTGGNVAVNQPTMGLTPSTAPAQPTMPQPVTPPTPTPTPAKTQAQIIQDLFNSSPTKDVAAIRIGDYARSVGGITAQQIADAVQPIVGGRPDFGIDPFDAGTGGSEVLQAVADGGYGGGFITETADQISVPQQTYNTLAQQQQQLRSGFGDDQRVGDADYTPQEAAYRMLDFAQRNNMSLDQAAQSFGLTEADARTRAGELDVDLTQFGFADGGEVDSPQQNVVEQIGQIMKGVQNSLQSGSTGADKSGALNQARSQFIALGLATPGGISEGQLAAGNQLSQGPYMEEESVSVFNQGGGVTEPADAYEEFTLSVRKGPNDIALEKRQQGVQNLMNSKSGIQPNEKMLSALDRIMGRNNG